MSVPYRRQTCSPRKWRADTTSETLRSPPISGCLVNVEIGLDPDPEEFPSMLGNRRTVQRLMGGIDESPESLPRPLLEVLTVLPPADVEAVIAGSGAR